MAIRAKENPGHQKTPLFSLYDDNCFVLIVFFTGSTSLTLQLWESWLSQGMQHKGEVLCSAVTGVTYRWVSDSKAGAGMQIRNVCKNMSALGQMHCWEMRQFCLKTIVLPEHESKERVHCVALEMKLFHEKRWALIIVKAAETQSETTPDPTINKTFILNSGIFHF